MPFVFRHIVRSPCYQQQVFISVSTVFILFNILLSLYLNVNWIVLVDILIWTFTNIRLTKRIGQLQSRQATNK